MMSSQEKNIYSSFTACCTLRFFGSSPQSGIIHHGYILYTITLINNFRPPAKGSGYVTKTCCVEISTPDFTVDIYFIIVAKYSRIVLFMNNDT